MRECLDGRRGRWSRGARAGVVLTASVLSVACSGGSADGSGGAISGGGGTGGDAPGTGGTLGGTGGEGVGGASGGTSPEAGGAATGGSAPGTGGSDSAGEGWEEVRCFEWGEEPPTGGRICHGRMGNLWTMVSSLCAAADPTHPPMDLYAESCGGEDDPAGWDETWCEPMTCYGRRGSWRAKVEVQCFPPSETPVDATPSEFFCDGAVEAPTGWENVQCFESDSQCFGFLGLYYPTWGLYPTCHIDANYANNPEFTEVTPDTEYLCP